MTHNPPTPTEIAAATWTKSTFSAPDNECVEVATGPGWTAVRDSKDIGRPHVVVDAKAFAAFVRGTVDGAV